MAAAAIPTVIQWVVYTRDLWPEVTETRHLETHPGASRALDLLPPAERAGVLKYVFVRDARMALASHLLKHYVVARHGGGVPWGRTAITRDARSKPVFVDPATGRQPVAFNVTHQDGVVALAAVAAAAADRGETTTTTTTTTVEIGIDVVSTGERRARDHDMVAADGWPAFVDMHADVFSPAEAAHLKYAVLSSAAAADEVVRTPEGLLDYKLRCFYTLWCLREAYVKMTGEALVAPWLRELEFRAFAPPPAPAGGSAAEGEPVTEHSIWLKGARVDDANVCLRSLGKALMVCTAVRTPGKMEVGLGMDLRTPFTIVTVDEIVRFAEANL